MIESSSETFNRLKQVPIFYTHDCKESNEYSIAYLDFVELNEEHDGEMHSVTFGRDTEENKEQYSKSLGLKLKVAKGNFDAIQINSDDVESLDAYEAIVDTAMDMIIERAYRNSERISKSQKQNYFKLDLTNPSFYFTDERKKKELQVQNLGRKLLSRILSISNLIAMQSRRGPASYVILPDNLYKMLEDVFSKKYRGLYNPGELASSVAGLSILCSDKLKSNQFIVGRKAKPEEPGFHLITSDSKLGNYLLDKPDNMIQKVDFKLLFIHDETKDNSVFGCEINWTDGEV
jgi:hypothetical protein